MRILIVGDNIDNIGGVCNYTRPLYNELSKSNNEVYYLYSSSNVNCEYDFTFRPKYKFVTPRIIKIVNSENLTKNYDNLDIDITSDKNDDLFKKIISEIRPDVMHINEIIGFSSNIIDLALRENIKVFVTVHEYWWLCPHRVMVDFNGKICEGPVNLSKCSYCINSIKKNFNSDKIKFKYRLQAASPKLFNMIMHIKKKMVGNKQVVPCNNNIEKEIPLDYPIDIAVRNRLSKNIERLNSCNNIIAVSKDVENVLIKYGVKKDKIIVQHIGSTIAEKQIASDKVTNPEHIVFGYIGGVGYYKGIHVLAEAFSLLSAEEKAKVQIDVYGRGDNNYIDSIRKTYLNGSADTNFCFRGAYYPQDIEAITKNIDIMVLPSLCADTAPQTIFESFSAGIPIIAPNIGGFPDFVIDKHNGLLFEPGSAVSLKEKIQYIIEHYEMIGQFRTRIPKLKKIKENADELIELYKKQ